MRTEAAEYQPTSTASKPFLYSKQLTRGPSFQAQVGCSQHKKAAWAWLDNNTPCVAGHMLLIAGSAESPPLDSPQLALIYISV